MVSVAIVVSIQPMFKPSKVIPNGPPVYSTDFHNVVTINGGWATNMTIQNSFTKTPDAFGWIEGLEKITTGFTCHSGTRCFGANASSAPLAGVRFELDMQPASVGVRTRFLLDQWVYLPSNWNVTSSDWYGMFQVSEDANPSWQPYYQFLISDHNHNGIVSVILDSRDVQGTEHYYATVSNFPLPRGKWFEFEWYEVRNSMNGEVATWINGQQLWDVKGLDTLASASDVWHIETDKIYNAGGQYKSWVDDLAIYNGILGSSTVTSLSSANSGASSVASVIVSTNWVTTIPTHTRKMTVTESTYSHTVEISAVYNIMVDFSTGQRMNKFY